MKRPPRMSISQRPFDWSSAHLEPAANVAVENRSKHELHDLESRNFDIETVECGHAEAFLNAADENHGRHIRGQCNGQ